ncbi:hypothetical protein GCM10023195_81360 [Actinoallomurus liliacearum]|uniref:Uncharacterized protein n=1 Tax=Actinoallomurus liliacearum TaxID=1080073 RepID=A0ABP8TWD7_9ACTN
MENSGYTFTTITGRPGEAMSVTTSFYLDESARIDLYGAGKDRPFLGIDHGGVSVNIGPRPNVAVTAQDVALVRRLADVSAALLAEVERIHAEQSGHAAA